MAERLKPETEGQTSTTTVVVQNNETNLPLKLRKPGTDRKVSWDESAVDNEGMNKKKSKCCCIYHKPKPFGADSDSSDDSDDDHCTDHCVGHKSKHDYKSLKEDSTVEVPPSNVT